jgi:hypothetical protein
MPTDDSFSLETARQASERGELAQWVADFLASPSSDNAVLADVLTERARWWVGPRKVSFDELLRLAGPSGDPVLCPVDDDYWDGRVDAIESLAEMGREPPPVIASYRDGELVLEDGNHRVEGLRRAGHREAWAVIGFETADDRERYLAGSESAPGTPES